MAFYKNHIFICTNQKEGDKKCCAQGNAEVIAKHAKEWLLQRNQHGPNKVRISRAACLGRCNEGPCVVVYPEGEWYTYGSKTDIERVLQHCLDSQEPLDENLLLCSTAEETA